MQGHAEYRQVVQVWIGRYSGGEGLLSHMSAIACMNGIMVLKSGDFLTFFFFFLSLLDSGLFLQYTNILISLLANKQLVVDQFLHWDHSVHGIILYTVHRWVEVLSDSRRQQEKKVGKQWGRRKCSANGRRLAQAQSPEIEAEWVNNVTWSISVLQHNSFSGRWEVRPTMNEQLTKSESLYKQLRESNKEWGRSQRRKKVNIKALEGVTMRVALVTTIISYFRRWMHCGDVSEVEQSLVFFIQPGF